jgi:hypothetical protein
MILFAHMRPAIGEDELHESPASHVVEFAHLRRAFERHVTWAADFARAGDPESAREAQLAADAICDELSDD